MTGGRFSKTTHWMKGAYLSFFGGPKKPVYEGGIEHGNGTMRVWLVLDDEKLAEVARLAPYILAEPDAEQRGHAFWHFENRQREYPCDQCSDAVRAVMEKWAKRIDAANARLPSPEKPEVDHG